MNETENKIVGFDFVRAFAIFFVFMGHIFGDKLIIRSLSPGLTMSVLGFISAYLLTSKYETFNGAFYVKRFSRIYSSLVVCLFFITLFHLFLSYEVINQHSIFHYMGLSFFMELFNVANKSSLGSGLWFVTIILLMYLLLPLICILYRHKYSKAHLIVVILLCLFFNMIMYGTASSWNVVMSFNIGSYVGMNSNIKTFIQKSFAFYLSTTLFILILCGLATSQIIPYEVRNFLLALYPFFAVPLLFKIGDNLKGGVEKIVIWFSSVSYEVYILHFYFINKNFSDIFPNINSMYLQFLIALVIVLPLAHIFSKFAVFISSSINTYLLHFQAVLKSTDIHT
nr:acyltransferase [Desulfobacula sp.]